MQYLLTGFVAALIGSIPFDYGHEGWFKKWIILMVIFIAGWAGVSYWVCPEMIGPFWGAGLWWMIFLGAVVNCIVTSVIFEGQKNEIPMKSSIGYLVLAVLLFMVGGLRGCAMGQSDEYRAFVDGNVKQSDWQKDIQSVDTAHIRMVSQEQAAWNANKVLGQADGAIGSKYKVGDLSIQKYRNELVWVAPLDFQGFRSWQKFDTAPGYVIVSAEDPSRGPKLVTGFKFRYMLSSYFGDDLERHMYENGYVFKGKTDYTFEIDDNGKPSWVVTIYQKTIGYSGEQVEGVAVVDPETGKITQYAPKDAPEWIERVIPPDFAFNRLTWYGKYVDGWLNSWWGEDRVEIPTDSGNAKDVWLTWGDDGRSYWFSGLTSSKKTDESLTGFVLMDTRSGAVKTYRLSGANEDAVMKVVKDSVSNYSNYFPTQPIMYNIYGELTWVVPVLSGDGIFQRIALVRASNSQVVLGKNKHEALAAYRQLLQTSGNSDAPVAANDLKSALGFVDRFSSVVRGGETTFYFSLKDDFHIYIGNTTVSEELPLTRLGDRVRIGYMETTEKTVAVSAFDLVDFESVTSQKQMAVDESTSALAKDVTRSNE